MLEEYLKKTEPEYYPPVENLLDLIYEHYTENNPVEKNTIAGKAAKVKERELEEWLRGLDGMEGGWGRYPQQEQGDFRMPEISLFVKFV